MQGEITSLVESKGFGFIKPNEDGDDIFFHNSAVQGAFENLTVGQPVEFELDPTAEKPRAKSVIGKEGGPPKGSYSSKSDNRSARPDNVDLLPQGKVTRLVEEKGFGFIKPNDGGDDIFFHNSAVRGLYEDLSLGQTVNYELDTMAEKPRAKLVVGRGGNSAGRTTGASEFATMSKGKVTLLVEEKGFGFIKPLKGGEDIFFHNSAVRGMFEDLRIGQIVSYELDPAAEKARAKSVVTRDGEKQSRRAGNPRGANPRRPTNAEQGFVTKVHQRSREGFISADKGGRELWFDESAVRGSKKFYQLRVGDYVQFTREETVHSPNSVEPPVATFVEVIEREPRKVPKIELAANPKRRKKKPTWR